MRPSERLADVLRPVTLETGVNRYAEGSCLVSFGHTKVLVTASLEEGVPGFLRGKGQGWVTAEYGMLPRATHTRGRREAAQGKQSGRTQEIQRLIGRSLRAIVDLKALGERQISIDCDVIQADGGTRTASITGAWVALRLATRYLLDEGVITTDPILDQVAADQLRRVQRHPGARPRLRGGLQRRGRRQLRADRLGRHRRDPGHRREARLLRGRVRGACSRWPARASANWSPCSRPRPAAEPDTQNGRPVARPPARRRPSGTALVLLS